MSNLELAFLITFLAGISTSFSSLIFLFYKNISSKTLSIALGFSAGAMLYLSFIGIFHKGLENLENSFSHNNAIIITSFCFFIGMILMAIIDKIFPEFHHFSIHSINDCDLKKEKCSHNSALKRLGIFSAFAICIHNFPEGIATFFATLEDPHLGISFAAAIAIHNIPEGIAISLPIYHATKSKKKAFIAATLAGLSEPLGALIAYLFLGNLFIEIEYLMGILFSLIAGIMVFIAIDELIPASKDLSKNSHAPIYSLMMGMIVMSLSLILLH